MDWLAEFERKEWIDLFRPLLDPGLSQSDRYGCVQQFNQGVKQLRQTPEQQRNYRLSIKDGVTLIRMIGSELEIAGNTQRELGNVALFLEPFQHPNFVAAIVEQYPHCPLAQRADLLCLLACQDPVPAAASLKLLIEQHGFPNVYQRVFWKLGEHTEVLGEYIVALIRNPGRHIGDAVNLINAAAERGHLELRLLDELAPLVEEKSSQLIQQVGAIEEAGDRHRFFDEEYSDLRHELGAWMDLLGLVPACEVSLLEQAQALDDPLVNLFLITALLAKSERVPQSALVKAASSYETLRGLHRTLVAQGALHLFPEEFATFEHLAAAEMVEWLLYPTELGEVPSSIELMHTLDGQDDEGNLHRYCLWRFADSEGSAFAGVSGPYDEDARNNPTPQSVRSSEVFSNFEPWEGATPEEHLGDILETLTHWRLAHAKPPRTPPPA